MRVCLITALLGGCAIDRDADEADRPLEMTVTDQQGGDSNEDGLEDTFQSFGFGVEDGGEPYLVIFDNPGLPANTLNLWLVGYGGEAYEPEAVNTWFDPWAPLVPYVVDGVRTGWAFRQMRDSLYQAVAVDAAGFTPYDGEGWQNVALGLTPWDDDRFVVYHVDGADCPEGGRESVHLLWEVRDGSVLPLTDGIAPPDPTCLE